MAMLNNKMVLRLNSYLNAVQLLWVFVGRKEAVLRYLLRIRMALGPMFVPTKNGVRT